MCTCNGINNVLITFNTVRCHLSQKVERTTNGDSFTGGGTIDCFKASLNVIDVKYTV